MSPFKMRPLGLVIEPDLDITLTKSRGSSTRLRSLPGEPKLVVCDDDNSIIAAVSKVWPNAFIKWCEHHLREGVRRKMKPYGTTTYGSKEMELLNDSLHSPKGWRDFK